MGLLWRRRRRRRLLLLLLLQASWIDSVLLGARSRTFLLLRPLLLLHPFPLLRCETARGIQPPGFLWRRSRLWAAQPSSTRGATATTRGRLRGVLRRHDGPHGPLHPDTTLELAGARALSLRHEDVSVLSMSGRGESEAHTPRPRLSSRGCSADLSAHRSPPSPSPPRPSAAAAPVHRCRLSYSWAVCIFPESSQ